MKNKKLIGNIILITLVILLAVFPLIFKSGAEFTGSDDQAEAAISDIRSDYKPWFQPIWEPPSGEIESLLFSVQAAIGAGVIGYYLGRTSKRKEEKSK